MKIFGLSAETSYILDPVAPAMSSSMTHALVERFKQSSRGRHRFCFHQNPEVDLHDIIICYDKRSYIPPNKHIGKVESLLVLQGALDFFLFSDSGTVYDYRRLSAEDENCPFFLRVPPNTWHGLRAVGDLPCIVKETISGPYDQSSLQWAPYAPSEAEGSSEGHNWYNGVAAYCQKHNISSPEEEAFAQISSNVFRSSRQLVTISRRQMEPVIKAAEESVLSRARVCCHGGPEDKLQEMFIALTREVDIAESMHLRKDESLTVVEGNGRYIFPNEDGSTRSEISLAQYSKDCSNEKSFYARINRYVPHKIVVDSPFLLIHEATTGPFRKDETDYRIKRADQ